VRRKRARLGDLETGRVVKMKGGSDEIESEKESEMMRIFIFNHHVESAKLLPRRGYMLSVSGMVSFKGVRISYTPL